MMDRESIAVMFFQPPFIQSLFWSVCRCEWFDADVDICVVSSCEVSHVNPPFLFEL